MSGKGLFSVFGIGLVIVFILMSIGGCGGMKGCNFIARSWGGSSTVSLDKGEKLVNLTWKETSLWILVRKAKVGEEPEVYEFREHSNLGILQGTIIVKEQ